MSWAVPIFSLTIRANSQPKLSCALNGPASGEMTDTHEFARKIQPLQVIGGVLAVGNYLPGRDLAQEIVEGHRDSASLFQVRCLLSRLRVYVRLKAFDGTGPLDDLLDDSACVAYFIPSLPSGLQRASPSRLLVLLKPRALVESITVRPEIPEVDRHMARGIDTYEERVALKRRTLTYKRTRIGRPSDQRCQAEAELR